MARFARAIARAGLSLVMLTPMPGGAPGAAQATVGPPPTKVVHFVPAVPPSSPGVPGDCWTTSIAAGFRADAYRCRTGNAIHDPCFVVPHAARVVCDVDPRNAAGGQVLDLTAPLPAADGPPTADHLAWFFALADGTTCAPLTGTRREIDGTMEIYACRFGVAGEADAALGDLDATGPVWTIRLALLNKKVDPPTIKSLIVTAVATVWQ